MAASEETEAPSVRSPPASNVEDQEQKEKEGDPKLRLIPIIINIIVMYFLFQRLNAKKQDTPMHVTEIQTPEPVVQAPEMKGPTDLLKSLFGETITGERRVPDEIMKYELERRSALADVLEQKSIHPMWPEKVTFDCYVTLSESPERPIRFFSQLDDRYFEYDLANNATYNGLVKENTFSDRAADPPLTWVAKDLVYDSSQELVEQHMNITLPTTVVHNMTQIWAHIAFVATGASPNKDSEHYHAAKVVHWTYPMIRFKTVHPESERVSLLGDDKPAEFESLKRKELDSLSQFRSNLTEPIGVPHWIPSLSLQLVNDGSQYPPGKSPPHVNAAMQVLPQFGGYLPHVYVNEFWLLSSNLIPIVPPVTSNGTRDTEAVVEVDDSTMTVPLHLSYSPQSLIIWTLQTQVSASWNMQSTMSGESGDGNADIFKTMLLETKPSLLILTAIVSILHMVFDFLAFRNDINFWRGKKSMEGMSLRSITLSVFFQGVILLYLFDNETSWMILGSTVVGFVIEVWKLFKAFSVSVSWPKESYYPIFKFDEDQDDSYTTSETKKYDEIAMTHTLLVLLPLILGMGIYSLHYEKHKGWYSWILNTLVSGIYTFGFVQMVPQLYINYKLKSVAHLPWKAMTYKALNTFVDDLFAFIIKMPTLHRLAAFRDDVIFVIFLYQKWKYPVDPTRKNEFGASEYDYSLAEARKKGIRAPPPRGKYDRLVTSN